MLTPKPQCLLCHGQGSFQALRTTPGSVYVDKTFYTSLIRPDLYQKVLLRCPPGFGKTTFLDMMARYHDIRDKDQFQLGLFGDTWIGRNLPQAQGDLPNQSLVLVFDLAHISAPDFTHSLKAYLRARLEAFLERYKPELKLNTEKIAGILTSLDL